MQEKPTITENLQVKGVEMQIVVRSFIGSYVLNVLASSTIECVKTVIQSVIGIPQKKQILYYGKCKLEDAQTLADYGIKDQSELLMLGPFLKLFIKMPQAKSTIRIHACNFEKVHDIKSIVWERTGIPQDRHTLVYAGRSLDDEETLSTYGIQNGSTLYGFFGLEDGSQEFKLFFNKNAADETYEVRVKSWYSILDVKTIIESMVGIPIDLQELTYNQEKLRDCRKLADYNIKHGCNISLLVSSSPVQLFIKSGEEYFMLEVKNSETINEIMTNILVKTDSTGKLNLFIGETKLEEDRTLAHYDIQSSAFLQLERAIQVNVTSPSGEVITVDLKATDDIDGVKDKIEDMCGIPWEIQTITYLEDELDGLYTLEDYEFHLGGLWGLRWLFGGTAWSFFWPSYAAV
nr:TPA_asm: hypothetical protein HUJ06_021447 [Nelumbo nucifera]